MCKMYIKPPLFSFYHFHTEMCQNSSFSSQLPRCPDSDKGYLESLGKWISGVMHKTAWHSYFELWIPPFLIQSGGSCVFASVPQALK